MIIGTTNPPRLNSVCVSCRYNHVVFTWLLDWQNVLLELEDVLHINWSIELLQWWILLLEYVFPHWCLKNVIRVTKSNYSNDMAYQLLEWDLVCYSHTICYISLESVLFYYRVKWWLNYSSEFAYYSSEQLQLVVASGSPNNT